MSTITYKDRRPETDHATRMKVRRARQRARTPGFTPVRNNRIAARITSTAGLLTAGYAATGKELPSAAAIQHEAERTVAKTLPQLPIGTRTRRFRGTGKTYRVEA